MLAGVVAATLLSSGVALRAQADPRQVLAAMILQLQIGRPNPLWYGMQLWQTIAYQTNNTGVYPQLSQLGGVQNVVVTQWASLPAGILYAMSVQHAYGQSFWVFGVSNVTNRIEYATFAAGPGSTPYTLPGAASTGANPLPAPSVGSSQPADDPPQPKTKPKASPPAAGGGGQSEACKKFPNLC
jgi:hypothetical protein